MNPRLSQEALAAHQCTLLRASRGAEKALGSSLTILTTMAVDDLHFHATIGVDVKGETWSCIEIPGSAEFFGTGKTVRVDAKVDDVLLETVGAMPTGTGTHMISLSAKVRRQLGKDIGDAVEVTITKR